MATAIVETLEQEYNRLASERTSEAVRRVREIVAIPPQGYQLPKSAADLIAHAEAHGWMSLVQWTPPGYEGEPFVTVQVGRRLVEGEMPDARGSKWIYKLTWHSRDCAAGKVRLFGCGHSVTPDHPAGTDAPSVKSIRATIEQHPAPEVES